MDMVGGKEHISYPEHCTIKQALALLLSEFGAARHRTESLAPPDALGRRLAEDVFSRRNVPHYVASAVDGYAVHARSTAEATSATPVRLDSEGYRWVNTGMPLEIGDAVVMVEDTSLDGGELAVFKSLTQGENVRAVGEDVMAGQMIATAGDRVTPALISLMLCAGIGEAKIRAKPRTLFIPTGDEIVDKKRWLADADTPAGLVVDSNSEFAKAIFRQWGFDIDVHPILPDKPDVIQEAIADAARRYDLVLVSAGSAKGKRDHTADIFNNIGRMLFRAVRMKPGRPVMAASVGGIPVVCTPGFPMSCTVVLWSLIYPLLKAMAGEDLQDQLRRSMGAVETVEAGFMLQHSSPSGVAEWLRLKIAVVKNRLLAWPLSTGASVLWSLAEADGIALLDEETLECEKGSRVQIHMLKHVDLARRLLFQGSDDPAIGLLVSILRESHGVDLAIRAVGSMGGLAALSRDEAHFAAAHLLDAADGTYNTNYIEKFAAGRKWSRRLVFYRQQGIIVARGNPRGIARFEDLARGFVFENRQPGAGTRVLLDFMLKESGLEPSAIVGYDRQSITHLEAANKVACGVADATLGIKAAADALGLDFIPIALEPYELVFAEDFHDHAAAGALMDALDSEAWKSRVERMGGYQWTS